MTIETSRWNETVEPGPVGGETRTIGPGVFRDEIRYRQLKKACAIIIKIGLCLSPGPYYHIKRTGSNLPAVLKRRLVKLVSFPLHYYPQMVVVDKTVFGGLKTAFNRFSAGCAAGMIMRRLRVGVKNGLMACPAPCGASIPFSPDDFIFRGSLLHAPRKEQD